MAPAADVTDTLIALSYRKATTSPLSGGPPATPRKVRVESAALARRLRPLLSGVAIEIRPTPEIDALLDAMQDAFEGPDADAMMLFLDTPEPWREELWPLATELAGAAPWDVVPPEPALELRIPALGVSDGRVSVMGHNGETYGLMVFFAAADLDIFEQIGDRATAEHMETLPRCLSVNLADLPRPPRGERADIALVMVFEDRDRRTPSETELKVAVAASRALARFVKEERRRLTHGPEHWIMGIERTFDVQVRREAISVELRAALASRTDLATILSSPVPERSRRSARKRPSARSTATKKNEREKPHEKAAAALAHTNRMGDTYYLHEGRTKTGKPRYFFARGVREGALAELPSGYEVTESINGVVSARRIIASGVSSIPPSDVAIVEAERLRHAHLRYHLVKGERDAIVVYAPDRDVGRLDELSLFPLTDAKRREWMAQARYAPMFRFVPERRAYVAHRMTFRGEGGWSRGLDHGTLEKLAKKFVSKIGTEAFFDLM